MSSETVRDGVSTVFSEPLNGATLVKRCSNAESAESLKQSAEIAIVASEASMTTHCLGVCNSVNGQGVKD